MAELSPEPDYGETSYRGHGRLEGSVALITEADSGLGRAVAIAFAREGADLVLTCLDDRAECDITAAWVAKSGRRALVVPGDVRRDEFRQALTRRAVESFGHLDILATCHAFQWAHVTLQGVDATTLEAELRTHNESIYFLSLTAAESMRPGGAIIHTAAMANEPPDAMVRGYAPTHAAVPHFTASLAPQLSARRIRINAIVPGPVWTKRLVSILPPDAIDSFGRDTPRGRPAQPAELAPVYVFLASTDAQLMTGAVLRVG